MKKFYIIIMTICLMLVNITTALAYDNEETYYEPPYSIDIEDPLLEEATIIYEETFIENDRLITVTQYLTKDQILVTDTLDRSAVKPLSDEGTDTVTRTRKIANIGTITLTASFSWYTDKSAGIMGVAYVACTGMIATNDFSNFVTCDIWKTERSEGYKSFGKAYAQVTYKVYAKSNPAQEEYSTFKITCDDKGNISSN